MLETAEVSLLELDDLDTESSSEALLPEDQDDDKKSPEGMIAKPAFIQEIDTRHRSNASHVFVLHGNVNDYPDNTGIRSNLTMTLFSWYDYFYQAERFKANKVALPVEPRKQAKVTPIAARWSVKEGLEFATPESGKLFLELLKSDKDFENFSEANLAVQGSFAALQLLKEFFHVSRDRFRTNAKFRADALNDKLPKHQRTVAQLHLIEHPEVLLTIIWDDAKMIFPPGGPGALSQEDRASIAYLEQIALDGSISQRNKIVLIVPHLSDLQESLRTGDSRVTAIRVAKPALKDRREWILNFAKYIETRPQPVGGKQRSGLLLAEDVSTDYLANMSAGMSRAQIYGVFMESWLQDRPVSGDMIAEHKRAAIEAEYGDILDIRQPWAGWKLLGYHDALRLCADRHIVLPMKLGDKRNMSRGVLLLGPPGTGKTHFAECLAGECKVNFVYVDFSKLYGGTVGETEKNTERLYEAIEAMAPCIVMMDELDSAGLSRQSQGDSGTTARVFNKTMKWLSDESRWGKIVVLAASNRPDLLDPAFIRAGRFDQILAALPPGPGNAKGRATILNALSHKMKIAVDYKGTLHGTQKNEKSGLGRLLLDKRIWTGAEMEALLKRAHGNAYNRVMEQATAEAKQLQQAGKLKGERELLQYIREHSKDVLVELEDWNKSMDSYRPRTRDVELMIDLALAECNDAEYVPEEWRSRMEDEQALSSRIKAFKASEE